MSKERTEPLLLTNKQKSFILPLCIVFFKSTHFDQQPEKDYVQVTFSTELTLGSFD